MKFFGRREQLSKLNRSFREIGFNFSLLYGRRRVGKSELVKQALKEQSARSVYYECKQVAESTNCAGLSDVVSEIFNMPPLAFDNIEETLKYIFDLSRDQKIVLVLDEYPYLRESVKGMDSILQSLIDQNRNSSNLSLVILGSYVDVMQSLLEHSNPLYGRVDLTINLKQMDYLESSLFYPNFSNEDKVRIYSIFGGIPYYNRLIDDDKSVKQNMIELIASPSARLENEVAMYLNSEIAKISNANEVFEALAGGFSKFSDILSQSHVSSSPTLVDVLAKLIRMEVVKKEALINDSKNRKKAGYYISDNLSLFYYRYIFRHLSQLSIMNEDVFYGKYIVDDFEQFYVPRLFEDICRQYLIRQNRAGMIEPAFEKIGKYYYDDPINHKNGEFDVVTEDEKGFVFYEAKFKKSPIALETVYKEIAQVQATNLKCYKHVFISRSGFNCSAPDGVSFLTLDDLFK